MLKFDYRDTVGGALLIAGGVAIAVYSASSYKLGSLQRLGPGMFPMGLGVILAFFGLVLLIQSFLKEGKIPDIRVWSPLFVLGGCAAFALVIPAFGLVPAVLACTIVTSFADLKVRYLSIAMLGIALSAIAFLLFRVALSIPVALFAWPF
jgi:hypothetical protein